MSWTLHCQRMVRFPGVEKTFVYFSSKVLSEIHTGLLLHYSHPRRDRSWPLGYSFIKPFFSFQSISFILLLLAPWLESCSPQLQLLSMETPPLVWPVAQTYFRLRLQHFMPILWDVSLSQGSHRPPKVLPVFRIIPLSCLLFCQRTSVHEI